MKKVVKKTPNAINSSWRFYRIDLQCDLQTRAPFLLTYILPMQKDKKKTIILKEHERFKNHGLHINQELMVTYSARWCYIMHIPEEKSKLENQNMIFRSV